MLRFRLTDTAEAKLVYQLFTMSTIAPVLVEFRCSRCWNSNCADSQNVGSEVACRTCGHKNVVPEATADRIERALSLIESEPELIAPKRTPSAQALDFDRPYTDHEMYELARLQSYVPLNQRNFQGYTSASALSRLLANIVDNILLGLSAILGVMLIIWVGKQGLGVADPISALRRHEMPEDTALILLCVLPTLFALGQWFLLATSGQTIGKKLLMMRIVTDDGQLPGFVRAVVMRNWVCRLLCSVPLAGPWFALVDVLFIFSSSRKCLHDHIAGTRVVSLM